MNRAHRWLCRSAHWRRTVEDRLLPWALDGVDLGAEVLEVGPGPGITTDLLRARARRLTCVEIDRALAAALAARLAGTNVTVLRADATALPLPDARFDGAVGFTMLHHVPSRGRQDRLLAEVARVLRPGAVFAGTDSLYSRLFGALHLFDTMVLVDPAGLPARLEAAGFVAPRVDVDAAGGRFRFRATRA
ncbi:MAG: class I SAM-dependent methyltransferase [Acidobacteriota bacterium]|nr:class I SAM-dependent methyltransferase [Acidobacteriota bacterium]